MQTEKIETGEQKTYFQQNLHLRHHLIERRNGKNKNPTYENKNEAVEAYQTQCCNSHLT